MASAQLAAKTDRLAASRSPPATLTALLLFLSAVVQVSQLASFVGFCRWVVWARPTCTTATLVSTAAAKRGFGDEGTSSQGIRTEKKEKTQQKEEKKRATQRIDAIGLYDRAKELYDEGKHREAMQLYRKARVAMGRADGKHTSDYGKICSNLASAFRELGKPAFAIDLYQEAKVAFAKSLGPEHPSCVSCLINLAGVQREAGDPRVAETFLKEAISTGASQLETCHEEYRLALRSLASLYKATNRLNDIQPLLLEEKRVEALAARLTRNR